MKHHHISFESPDGINYDAVVRAVAKVLREWVPGVRNISITGDDHNVGTRMKLDPRTIATLWELRDHIDDPYVYGDLTGWLECEEGCPPYSSPVADPDAPHTCPPGQITRIQAETWQCMSCGRRWNGWHDNLPGPAPGTHESDLIRVGKPCCPLNHGAYDPGAFAAHHNEAIIAARWSREHAT